jgi:hypothetical protein
MTLRALILKTLVLVPFLFLSSFLNESMVHAETEIKESIQTDTTWTKENSPYILSGDIQVDKGVSLTIEPGVVVMGNGSAIKVAGQLYAEGIEDDYVTFRSTYIDSAGSNGNNSYIKLSYSKVLKGSIYSSSWYGSLQLTDSIVYDTPHIYLLAPYPDAHIERNIFYKAGGIDLAANGAEIFIRNNLFLEQTTDFAIKDWSSFEYSATVEHNSFMSTDRVALTLTDNYDNSRLTASNNYWNTTDLSVINSMVYDRNDDPEIENEILIDPILEEPHELTPVFENKKPDTPSIYPLGDADQAIKGNAEPGMLITVKHLEEVVGQTLADENGYFEVDIPHLYKNMELIVTATNDFELSSDPETVVVVDNTLPEWESNPVLTLVDKSDSFFEIAWSTATDNTGGVLFEIYRDGQLVDTVNHRISEYTLNNVESDKSYTISVKAVDYSGNKAEQVISNTFSTLPKAKEFPDVNLYEGEIQYLTSKGVIKGYQDGSFKPNDPIKRLQAIQMILNALGIDVEKEVPPTVQFTDLKPGEYGYKEVAIAASRGIISGKNDGSFDPWGMLTRGQMAKILSKAFDLYANDEVYFRDIYYEHWAKEFVGALASNGITTGYSDGTFKPEKILSRQHFSAFLARHQNDMYKSKQQMDMNKLLDPALSIEKVKRENGSITISLRADKTYTVNNTENLIRLMSPLTGQAVVNGLPSYSTSGNYVGLKTQDESAMFIIRGGGDSTLLPGEHNVSFKYWGDGSQWSRFYNSNRSINEGDPLLFAQLIQNNDKEEVEPLGLLNIQLATRDYEAEQDEIRTKRKEWIERNPDYEELGQTVPEFKVPHRFKIVYYSG